MELVTGILATFITTTLLVWALKPVANKFGLIDHPGGRKKHLVPTPLIGGLAIFGGLSAGILVSSIKFSDVWAIMLGAAIMLVVGIVDDKKNLTPRCRFVAQTIAALIAILGNGIVLSDLGHLFGEHLISLGWLSIPFTIFAIVGVINAVNMSDGMDGLAGSLSLVTVTSLCVISYSHPPSSVVALLALMVPGIVAFLIFNMRTPWLKRAKIFLGDSGSMAVGFLIACLIVSMSQGETRTIHPATALWIFALPLLDTVCIMLRRILKGRSPFAPDREHFHHILLLAGYNPAQSIWIMFSIASGLALIGLIGELLNVPEAIMFGGFLMLFSVYFWGMSHAWRVMRAIKHQESSISGGATEGVMRPVKRSKE